MLIADPLLVDPDSLDGEHTISGLQPARIELIVRDDEEEDDAQRGGEAAVDQENNLPRGDGSAVFAGTHGNPVRDQAAEDLAEAVEGEPKARAETLLALGVPLAREESEARCDSCLEDSQEDCICCQKGGRFRQSTVNKSSSQRYECQGSLHTGTKNSERQDGKDIHLIATAPPKSDTVANNANTVPQATTQKAEYFARGSLCKSRLVGYSQAR